MLCQKNPKARKVLVPILWSVVLFSFGFTVNAQVVINPLMTDSLVGDQNNDGLVNPGDTIQYKITIPSSGSQGGEGVNYQHILDTNSTLVGGSVKTTPLALNDTFSAGCTGFTAIVPGVLINDFDDNIPSLTVIWNSSPSNLGQAVAVAADGSFTYPSTEDLNATDNFRYAVQDADGNTDTGFVFVTVNSLDQLIFVDKSGPNGNGTSTNPYNNLADAEANSGPGDTIFLYEDSPGSYANGIVLQNNQVLLGEEAGLNSKCITIAPGSRPSISNASGNAITLAQNNTIKGIKASNSSSGFSIADNGGVGILTIRDVEVSNSLGGVFRADNGGTLDVVLDAAGNSNGAHAIDLDGCNGFFSVVGTTDVGGTSSTCVTITNNTATVSFADLLINTNSSNQKGLVVNGGMVNATSGIVVSGSAAALEINGAGTSGFTLDSIYTSGTSGNAVDLATCAGTWSLGKVDITRTTGTAIDIDEVDTVNTLGGIINSTNGTVLDINEAAVGMTLDAVSSNSSSGAGIQLDDISGTLTMNGGSITGASGHAFDVGGVGNGSGGNATVTYAGDITNTSGRSVFIQELGGGSITLSGDINDSGDGIKVSEINNGTAATVTFSGTSKVVSTGTSTAIELADNTNGTINFTNGGLDIDATSGTGLLASDGGAVNISGANNTVNTTTGTAVDMDNVALAITFKTVSSTGGSNPGIVLNTTSGSFEVTGDGTSVNDGSGGVISGKSENGIVLNNAQNISLHRMNISANDANGVFGNAVTGLNLNRCNITNNGNAVDEGALRIANNLLGICSFTNCLFTGSAEHNIEIINTSRTLTSLNISNTEISNNSSGLGADGILLETRGSALATVVVSGCTFNNNKSDCIQISAIDNSTANLTVNGSSFTSSANGSPQGSVGARAINLSNASTADLIFDISGPAIATANTFSNFSPAIGEEAINIAMVSTTTTSAFLNGKIRNNTFSNSGGAVGIDFRGKGIATVEISGNIATTGMNRQVIDIITGDAVGDSPSLSLNLLNNTLGPTNIASDVVAIEFTRDSKACMNIRNNQITRTGTADGIDIFDDTNTGPVNPDIKLEADVGAGSAQSQIEATNTILPTVDTSIDDMTLVAPGTCTTP